MKPNNRQKYKREQLQEGTDAQSLAVKKDSDSVGDPSQDPFYLQSEYATLPLNEKNRQYFL